MLGLQELILILVISLIVFGPQKLPEIARDLGKAYLELKKASNSVVKTMSSELKTELDETRNIVKNLDIDTDVKNNSTTLDGETEGQSIKRVTEENNNKNTE